MMKTLTAILAICCITISAAAQDIPDSLKVRNLYPNAPFSAMPLVEKSTRLDMIDYFEANDTTKSKNSVSDICYIKSLSPLSLTAVEGEDVEYQVFIIDPMGKKPVIGVVETLYLPVADSYVYFYDTDWRPIEGLLPEPRLADWSLPEYKKNVYDAADSLPYILVSCVYDPESATLTFTNNTEQTYLPSDMPAALPMLRKTLQYKWNGKMFKPVK